MGEGPGRQGQQGEGGHQDQLEDGGRGRVPGVFLSLIPDAEHVMRLGHQGRLKGVGEQQDRIDQAETAECLGAQAASQEDHQEEVRPRDEDLVGDGPVGLAEPVATTLGLVACPGGFNGRDPHESSIFLVKSA